MYDNLAIRITFVLFVNVEVKRNICCLCRLSSAQKYSGIATAQSSSDLSRQLLLVQKSYVVSDR